MRYDQLRTLSFRLVSGKEMEEKTFYVLKFPEQWKSELRNLQAKLKGRKPEKTSVPIGSLNKAMRALVPDIIYIEPYAARSGDRPWLYSDTAVNREALHLIICAWAKVQFSKASEQKRSELLGELKVEDLCWQPTKLNLSQWTTTANGTAKLGGDGYNTSFILVPHILAAKFSQDNTPLKFGSELLRFRRAPLSIGTHGAELVSWQPLEHEDWYWSVVITFTLQTVPFQDFPVLHCDLSVRRWASKPIHSLPGGRETSIYLLTGVPWLEELHNSNSFQVAPIKWERVPASKPKDGEPNYRLTWGSNLAALLDRLQPKNPFPTPEDIKENPLSALNFSESPNAGLLYRNGIKPEHGAGPGLGPQDRRNLAEQIARVLAPDWQFVEMPERVDFDKDLPTTIDLPKPKNDWKPKADRQEKLEKMQLVLRRGVKKAVGDRLKVEVWYQSESARDNLIAAVRYCLGVPEAAEFPYKFDDLDLTLNVSANRLGALGDKLKLDSGIKQEKERRRQAIVRRGDEVREKAGLASVATVAFVELLGAKDFDRNTDPKQALRRGFAQVGRLTQFIALDNKNLVHRGINGFLDLLRQLGVQAEPLKIAIQPPDDKQKSKLNLVENKKQSLPEKIDYVGLWLIKFNSSTSADGSTQRVPVMVHMASDTTEIKAIALGFESWLPYREALIRIAGEEVRGVAKLEKAMPFIKERLRRFPKDTLLLCHAQNLRRAWPWLQNGLISPDEIRFGKENPLSSKKFKGLRIVRVRDSQSNETPEWYAQQEERQGFTDGIFKMGERVFASTYNTPKQFKKQSVNQSKAAPWTTNRDKTYDASPEVPYWNPGIVELTVAYTQPEDEIWPWAALTHELRHIALQYDEPLKLPLVLHLAKEMQEYVSLLEVEEE